MTKWAQAAAEQCHTRRDVWARATVHVGLRESPSNDDPGGIIRAWLRGAGVGVPAAYCASAVSAWLDIWPGEPGAQKLGKRFQEAGSPGFCDLGWYPTGPWQGHVFLVIGGDPDEVLTLEANAQNQVGVFRRERGPLRFATPFARPGGELPPLVRSYPRLSTRATTR
jgi:hypothetical protein